MNDATLAFKTVAVLGKPQNPQVIETTQAVHDLLLSLGCEVWVQQSLKSDIKASNKTHFAPRSAIGDRVELIVVVGGDGSMLNAGRTQVDHQIPMVGINRGHLGFLTDVRPTEVIERLSEIIRGEFIAEDRYLLRAQVIRNDTMITDPPAVNEVVVHPGEVSKMLEFELFIDKRFVYSQRSDGLIVSTPTGSTAYALSGGGPIISPQVDALVLVPMFPHTLSSRPIVIDANSEVEIVIGSENRHTPILSCDGQENRPLSAGDTIRIQKHPLKMRILHPVQHDYYEILRTKLGWGQKL